MQGSAFAKQERGSWLPYHMFLILVSPSLNSGLNTQKVEGRCHAPELPGAHGVCFLAGGPSPALPARDVGPQLPAVQERSPGAAVAGRQESKLLGSGVLGPSIQGLISKGVGKI